MGQWPGDTCRPIHEWWIFHSQNYFKQSINATTINCHRKSKCSTSITWPVLMGYWITTIIVVINLMRKLCRILFYLLFFAFPFIYSIIWLHCTTRRTCTTTSCDIGKFLIRHRLIRRSNAMLSRRRMKIVICLVSVCIV